MAFASLAGRVRALLSRAFLRPAGPPARRRRGVSDFLCCLYCAALFPLAPLGAAAALVLWIQSRAGRSAVGRLVPAALASYLYLLYAFAFEAPGRAWLDGSVLAALNVLAWRIRAAGEAAVAALSRPCDGPEPGSESPGPVAARGGCAVEDLGEKEFSRARRGGGPFSIMLIGLEGPASAGARFGAPSPGNAPSDIAGLIRAQLRPHDVLGRRSGREFLVILPGADCRGALDCAERIRRALVGDAAMRGGRSAKFDIDIGVAAYGRRSRGFGELLEQAAFALFEARTRGRGSIRAWPDPDDRRGHAPRPRALGG